MATRPGLSGTVTVPAVLLSLSAAGGARAPSVGGQGRPAGGARLQRRPGQRGGLAAAAAAAANTAGFGGRTVMAPLLLLFLSLLPVAAAYLCCVRRHTGSAGAVLRRREPGRAEAGSRSPPRDPVSAGEGGSGRRAGRRGGEGAGPGAHLSPPLRSGHRGCAAPGCASSSMWLTR